MAYSDHFKLTDDLILHLNPVLTALNDPFIESRYVGFLAVSGVTVLELALKNIFCDFSEAKHPVLGNFCSQYFDRINGRIGLQPIKEDYLAKFGLKYKKDSKLESKNLSNNISGLPVQVLRHLTAILLLGETLSHTRESFQQMQVIEK